MPKDIRSYFSKVSTQPKQNGLEKKTNSKKRAIIESDEEDAEESSVIKNKKAKINQNEEKVKTSKLTEIPVSSTEKLFSKKPIKRVAAPKVTKKVKNTSKDKSSDLFDDEFDESLNQIDTSNFEEKIVEKNDAVNKKSNKHEAEISKNNNEEQDNKTGVKKSDSKSDKNSKKEKKEKKESKAKYEMEVTKSDASEKEKKKPKDDLPDFIQEKIEKKKGNAKLYQNYLNRGGARNPGSKEIPKGADSCLSGLTFIISGVLDSLEREEAEEIIKQYGGNVVKSVSKKLDYIIIGDQAGPSKLLKAECLGIKKLSEDDLLELIKTRPGGVGNEKVSLSKESRKIESPKKKEPNIPVKSNSENNKRRKSESPKKNKEDVKESHKKVKYDTTESPKKKDVNNYSKTETSNSQDEKKNVSVDLKKGREKAEASASKVEVDKKVPTKNSTPSSLTLHSSTALVDKYRPKEMKQIIGQSGDKSNAKKLYNWLSDWHKKLDVKKSKAKPTHKDDAGAIFKAALLSGPPGIGKTTTAHVVAANLGFDVIEFNASDTRSKKLLQAEISSLLSNTNLKSLMTDKSKNIKNSKHVLIMDEVDGMAGNEDRGGLQELITLIKNTEVPIICICNDRMNQKMRTLGDYTYDLRFQKPRIEQIKGAMMTLCCRENIKISPDELQLLIQATNQDIRQIINHLALLSSKATEVNKPQEKLKNLRLGPWDVVRKVFSADEHKHMNLYDKSDLFFHDYNIASLFVQENYLSVVPAGSKGDINKLEKVSKSSESLALGDLIEKKIRESSAWSLLPVQAIFSSVIPGATMSGYITSQINFPQWLGKNSRRNKFDRLMQDITMHTQLTTGANKEAINLDYVKLMLNSIVRPLINDGLDGIDAAVDVMVKYNLLREDLDSLIELNTWPGKTNPMQSIDTKVKTAFTKACNKKVSKPVATFSKKRKNMSTEDDIGSDQDKSDNDDDEDDIKNDKMIKAKITKNNSDKGEASGSKTKNTKKTEAAGKKSSKKTTASKKK